MNILCKWFNHSYKHVKEDCLLTVYCKRCGTIAYKAMHSKSGMEGIVTLQLIGAGGGYGGSGSGSGSGSGGSGSGDGRVMTPKPYTEFPKE